ncbi:YceD family protein [Pectinatus sottacetonis]|uniref:YceD family protein n=1 Tax=Pectinatus sottacetonis TaxID=1002795 RepID=UPI0018C61C32|nr:DUF177 domain-containing protein [Pectinatus sottacetonis]
MMRIKLSDVNNTSGRRYEFAFDIPAGKFDFPTNNYRIDGMIKVGGIAENTGAGYHLQGSVKCRRHFVCDRCLEEVTENQVHNFDEIYAKKSIENQKDVNIFSGDFIDITDLIHDIVIVGQPIINLCRPDCKGLCPKCGTNLNKHRCSCDNTVIDPRLMVLKKLLEKD